MPDVAGLMSQSTAAAMTREADAHALWTSAQGAGSGGHTVGGGADMYEWDSGLAVSEAPGEA
jgi:hypothetical protein